MPDRCRMPLDWPRRYLVEDFDVWPFLQKKLQMTSDLE